MILAAFLNPGLLALGGALLLVPILIHLLNRRRVNRVPWAAMPWLLAAAKRHQRRLRLENWLILLLRVLAVALLALALARPKIADSALAGMLGSKQSVYLVLDTSYSMDASREGRKVIDLAKAEANAVLSGLGAEDSIAVLVTNDPRLEQGDGLAPRAIVPRSVGREGQAKAKEAVATLGTRDAAAPWSATLLALRDQLANEDVNRLVVLVTDLQRRDWTEEVLAQIDEFLRLPASVRVIDVGGSSRRNLGVANVTTPTRRDAFVGRPLRVSATIENHGPLPVTGARVDVYLDDGKTVLDSLTLPEIRGVDALTSEPGQETATLDLPGSAFRDAGSHVLRVEVTPPASDPDADGLALDSRREYAFTVRDRVRVVAWTRSSDEAALGAETYLRGVYERYGEDERGERVERNPLYELTTVATQSAFLDALKGTGARRQDLVVLANVVPPRAALERIRSFVAGGGALLVFVGDKIQAAALNEAFYTDPATRLLPLAYAERETRKPEDLTGPGPFLVDLERPSSHPLAAPFTGDVARGWIGLMPPRIWGRMSFREVPGGPGPDGGGAEAGGVGRSDHVVLRYADEGHPPFVVEGGFGAGRTLWVSTSIDQGWFERALPFFLPVFLDEAAIYLTRPDAARLNVQVGRRLLVTWLDRDVKDVRFVGPRGMTQTPVRRDGSGDLDRPTFVLDRVGTVGTWRLSYQQGGLAERAETTEIYFAVTPDPAEGALLRAEEARVLSSLPSAADGDFAILTSWTEVTAGGGPGGEGELATLLLWILAALLVVESVLAWAFGRQGTRPEGTGS